MKFEAKHEGYQQKVKESFNRQGFMEYIGGKLIKVTPGYCEIEIPYGKNLTQQHGYFHAGIVSTIADNAAGYAGFSLMEEQASVLTVEFKLNLLAPAKGDTLIARGTVLKSGRTLTVCKTEVYGLEDTVETLCAVAQTTLIQLSNTLDHPK